MIQCLEEGNGVEKKTEREKDEGTEGEMMVYRKSKCRQIFFFYPFIPYPSSLCSLIVVEPISLQPLPIGAHKEIKPPCYQLTLYAALQ